MEPSYRTISASTASKIAIADQYDYYAMKQDTALAERWEVAVSHSLTSLCTMSKRGAHCHLRHPRLNNLRWIPVGGFPFRVFYWVDEEKPVVHVVHILHEKRDIPRTLAGTL